MAVVVKCSCGRQLKAPLSLAGKQVKCPHCGAVVNVPLLKATPDVASDETPQAAVPEVGKTDKPSPAAPVISVSDSSRRAARPAKKRGNPALLYGAIGAASVLILIVVLALAGAFTSKQQTASTSPEETTSQQQPARGAPDRPFAPNTPRTFPDKKFDSPLSDQQSFPTLPADDKDPKLPSFGEPTTSAASNASPTPSAAPQVDAITLANTALADTPVELVGGYTLRLPDGFSLQQERRWGTPERWRIEQQWAGGPDNQVTFSVAIERANYFANAREPRVSNRIDPDAELQQPVSDVDGVQIVPGGEIDRVELADLKFTRVQSRSDQPPARFDAILYTAYDGSLLIRVAGFCSKPLDAAAVETLDAAARSFARPASPTAAPPNDLVVDERQFPTSLPAGTPEPPLAAEEAIPSSSGPALVSLAISPTARFAVAGNEKGDVLLFNPATPDKPTTFTAYRGSRVDIVAVPDDGKSVIVSCRTTGSSRVFDPDSGQAILALDGGGLYCAEFSRDSKTLVLAQWAQMRFFDWNEKHNPFVLGGLSEVLAIAVSDDGRFAVRGNVKGTVAVWVPGADNFEPLAQTDAHPGGTIDVAISPDGKRVISAGKRGDLIVWSIDDNKQLARFDNLGNIHAITFLSDGERIAVQADQFVKVIDGETGEEVERIDLGAPISLAAFSADRSLGLFVPEGGSSLKDIKTWRPK